MSELCSSKSHFSSLIISDLILLCSFILSHPLYFSYVLFFSPFLIKLISFLSPLFLTTSLLFLAFLVHTQSSSQIHFTSILQRLHLNKQDYPNEEDDDLGIYEILFAPPSMAAMTDNENGNESPSETLDQTPQKDHILEPNPFLGSDKEAPIIGKIEKFDENKVSKSEAPAAAMEEKRLENFLKILDEFERRANPNAEEKSAKKKQEPSRGGAKHDKVVEKQNSLLINGSEAPCNYYYNQTADNNATTKEAEAEALPTTMARSHSQRIMNTVDDDRDSLSTYGSMRREREWKRTLACKLFEERHNAGAGVGGGEGMDSLWETYETDSSKAGKRRSERVGRREKSSVLLEEDDVVGRQLCCLQALKMSAGKMNLGVGRPNLVKISKAIKGIGWLHNLTKNSKKVHNNGDHRF